jgi:hypothetical protein
MKNIHIIPTEKPSRLADMEGLLVLGDNLKSPIGHPTMYLYQNIYITSSNEEIKEGDITIYGKSLFLVENILHSSGPFRHLNPKIKIQGRFLPDMTIGKFDSLTPLKKIILTTDPDFSVQSIDDEFLEWFVKNPSCEWVEVEKGYLGMCGFVKSSEPISKDKLHYKIIIPQEEPKTYSCCGRCNGVDDICILDREEAKQRAANYMRLKGALEVKEETLEEAAERAVNSCFKEQTLFKLGANWQAERMGLMEIELRHTKTLLASCEKALEDRDKQAERSYSEEDMNEYADYCWSFSNDNRYKSPLSPKEWFEQFKKK